MSSKLLDALATFSREDWRSFRKYLLTEVSDSSDVYAIFSTLKKCKDRISYKDTLEKIHLNTFQNHTNKGFLNLQSKLYNIIEKWFIIEELFQQPYNTELFLIKQLNKRSLYKHADQRASKLLNKLSNQNLDSYNEKVRSELYHSMYYSNNPIKYREGAIYLEKLVESFMKNMKTQLYIYQAELINWGRIRKYDFSNLIEKIMIINDNLPSSDADNVLSHLIPLIKEHSLEDFLVLFDCLVTKESIKPNSEFHTLITLYSIWFAQILWQTNRLENPEMLINLFNYALQNGIYEKHGKIESIKFHNIINFMAISNTYGEVDLFIKNWVTKVAVVNIESTKKLAQAQNAFYHEKYIEIIPLTRDIEQLEPHQKSRALSLNMIGHYYNRFNDYDLFMNTLKNYKRFLQRYKKNYSKHVYRSYYILAKAVELMAKNQFTIEELDIDYKGVIFRTWLEKELRKREA